MYRAFDELEQMVNLVAIDSKFDFGKKMKMYQLYLTKLLSMNLIIYLITVTLATKRITIHKKKLI
jgi:hypothetical protein